LLSSSSSQQLDIVINACSSSDMHLPQRGDDVSQTTDYYHMQRTFRQEFVRAVLEPNCHNDHDDNNNNQASPLLIFLDDYLGPHHDHLLGELTGIRTLVPSSACQLCHHGTTLGLGGCLFIYLGTRLVILDIYIRCYYQQQQEQQSKHATVGSWTFGSHVVSFVFLFGLHRRSLCSHQAITETTTTSDHPIIRSFYHPPVPAPAPVPFVKPEVVELVTNVIPPPLNVDLTLNNVSYKWRQGRIRQRQACEKLQIQQQENHNSTTTTMCPMYNYPGAGNGPTTTTTITWFGYH
jgi:hypothetical protein